MKNSKFKELIVYSFFRFFIFIMRFVGIKNASNFCAKFFAIIGPWVKTNKVVRNNLHYIYKNISEARVNELQKAIWSNFGRYVGEFAFIDEQFLEENKSYIKIEIDEETQKIFDQKTPIMIFSGHMANWDIALFGVSELIENIAVIYRKINNKYIDNYVRKRRAINNARLISKGSDGVKDLVKSIREKRSFVMLVDQKMNDGIQVPFLGKKAMTSKAIASIALQYKYPIIPVQIIRNKDNLGFKLIFHKPIEIKDKENKEAAVYDIMLDINNILAGWVNERPEQWFWLHQRWGKPHEMTDSNMII